MEEKQAEAKAPEEKAEPPKKKTKKELEEEKARQEEEARLAAEEAAREKEREGLIEKLEKLEYRETWRFQQQRRREITDKVREFAIPEQQARANIQAEYDRAMKDIKAEFEQALKELTTERDKAYRETTKVRDEALEALRRTNKVKYDAMEAELDEQIQKAADRFEGFKNHLNSATLDELRDLAKKRKVGDRKNDATGTAEAGA